MTARLARRALVAALVAALVVALGACDREEQATPVSSPTTDTDDGLFDLGVKLVGETRASTVRLVTLRNTTGNGEPAEHFGEGRDTLRAALCETQWTPIEVLGTLSRNSPLYIPSEDVDTVAVTEQPLDDFLREYRGAVSDARPVVYVHGYNVGFEKSCHRAARFAENLQLGERLLLFSWPSDGGTLDYTRDEADLFWSVAHLGEVLGRMEELFGRGGFDVFAHSLGARGATFALSLLTEPADTPLVDRLVLAAPDIDADIFRQLLPRLRRQAAHITVYLSGRDSALAVSREVHGYPRLGQAGDHIVDLPGVEVIDVSDLPVRRVTGHLYHLYNEPVFSDIGELLNKRLGAADRTLPRPVDPTLSSYWKIPAPGE